MRQQVTSEEERQEWGEERVMGEQEGGETRQNEKGKRHGGGGGRGGETKGNVSGLCRRGKRKASVRPAETARREKEPPV